MEATGKLRGGWTFESRMAYFHEKSVKYPFPAEVDFATGPKPTDKAVEALGVNFVRVPFKEIGVAFWAFLTAEDREKFAAAFKVNTYDVRGQ